MILAGILVSCTNDLDRVAAIEMPAAAPDRITFNAEYMVTDSGRVKNVLKAGRIEEYNAELPRTVISEGLELSFYDSVGDPGSVLTARRGIIMPGDNRMEVYEDVVFVNVRGERLETEELSWLQDSAKVRTDKPVRIKRGSDIIYGVGLDASQDFSQYTIHSITGEIYLADDDTLAP